MTWQSEGVKSKRSHRWVGRGVRLQQDCELSHSQKGGGQESGSCQKRGSGKMAGHTKKGRRPDGHSCAGGVGLRS